MDIMTVDGHTGKQGGFIGIGAKTVIKNLHVKYTGDTAEPDHGDRSGGDGSFSLDDGEFVTKIHVCSGSLVDSLIFTTNKGKTSIKYGGGGGSACLDVEAPEGTGLMAFYGRSAGALDNIGFYFGPICSTDIKSITGRWEPYAYSSQEQTMTMTTGVTSGYTKSNSKTWGQEATKKASAGFTFKGASVGVEVTSTTSSSISTGYEKTFEMNEIVEQELTFPAGQIWIWKFVVEDVCGETTVTKSSDWVHTKNADEIPCCPVGYAKEPDQQHGECTDPALSVCVAGHP